MKEPFKMMALCNESLNWLRLLGCCALPFERDTCKHEFPFSLHRTATMRRFTARPLVRAQKGGNEKRPTNKGETIFVAPAAGLEPAT